MQIAQREFQGIADIQAMAALSRAFAAENLHVVDLPYRFSSWALDEPSNIGIWGNPAGELVGWAIIKTPFWTIDYAYDPRGGAGLHRAILDWAGERARQALGTPSGRACWFVMVLSGHEERVRDLVAAGFSCQSDADANPWLKVLMVHDAEGPLPAHALPSGFVIRPLKGEHEVEAYVDLHRVAFGSQNMTIEWGARTLRCPEYMPELDLVAVEPDGRLAGFSICWLDRGGRSSTGQIEPLGVRADLARQGLGRGILSEGLRRLDMLGAQQFYVETDGYRSPALSLYESAGFR
jgi:GNAT superfamily N-acetyltransferase